MHSRAILCLTLLAYYISLRLCLLYFLDSLKFVISTTTFLIFTINNLYFFKLILGMLIMLPPQPLAQKKALFRLLY